MTTARGDLVDVSAEVCFWGNSLKILRIFEDLCMLSGLLLCRHTIPTLHHLLWASRSHSSVFHFSSTAAFICCLFAVSLACLPMSTIFPTVTISFRGIIKDKLRSSVCAVITLFSLRSVPMSCQKSRR